MESALMPSCVPTVRRSTRPLSLLLGLVPAAAGRLTAQDTMPPFGFTSRHPPAWGLS